MWLVLRIILCVAPLHKFGVSIVGAAQAAETVVASHAQKHIHSFAILEMDSIINVLSMKIKAKQKTNKQKKKKKQKKKNNNKKKATKKKQKNNNNKKTMQ